jgi:hypothetical protein
VSSNGHNEQQETFVQLNKSRDVTARKDATLPLPVSLTYNTISQICDPEYFPCTPTTTLYTLNMAGKVKLSTKKTQLQQAEHDHVINIAIAEYHADRNLGH